MSKTADYTTKYPWLKTYPSNISWDAKIDAMPVYEILNQAAQKFSNNIVIDFLGKTYSYIQLKKYVDIFAANLKKNGVTKNKKVAIILPNCPQFIISYYAILKIGAVVVNCNPLYTVNELEHQLRDSDTDIVITNNLKIILDKIFILKENNIIDKVIISDFSHYLPLAKSILFKIFKSNQILKFNFSNKIISFEQLLKGNSVIEEKISIDPFNDTAVLQYTGGTTGVSKGAVLTHANIYINAVQSGLWFSGLEVGKETIMGVLPLFHVFAMTVLMNMGILEGCKIILHPKFDIKLLIKDLVKKRPTILPGVPTLFAAITHYKNIENYNLSSVKMCISGGAPLALEIKKNFEKITSCVLVEGYGLTETSPVVSANPLFGLNKDGSVGLPFPQTIIEIRNVDTGEILPIGETGEICIKGPQVMKGYYKSGSEENNKIFWQDSLRTGDLGYIDSDGYIYIVDRLKDMIINGGFNVYPREVEEAILKHDAVKEVAVIGISDELRGQLVKAVIVLKENKSLTKSQLLEFLKGELTKYKLPSIVEFTETLPKTMIGKISKKDLKK